MRAYIASSPYQVLNSLQMHYPFKDHADIYVLDQFSNCSFLVDNLKRSEVFRHVVRVRNFTYATRRRICEFMDRNFFYSSKVSGIIEGRVYEQVYFAAMDMTVYMLLKEMKKRNQKLIIKMIEDGMGDYVSEGFQYFSITDNWFHHIFGGEVFPNESEVKMIRENSYLYAPQLVLNIKMRSQYKKLTNNYIYADFKEKVNAIYHFKEESVSAAHVLVFDTFTPIVACQTLLCDQMKKVINLLIYYFGGDEVRIKLHPRTKENLYDENIKWGNGNIPAEVYFANMGDSLSEKIIVSVASTSCATPKIIFDEEPYIISLHKLFRGIDVLEDENFIECEEFLKRLEDVYHETGKIFVPDNREELEDTVRLLAAGKSRW